MPNIGSEVAGRTIWTEVSLCARLREELIMSRYVDADGHIMEKTADFIGYLLYTTAALAYGHVVNREWEVV